MLPESVSRWNCFKVKDKKLTGTVSEKDECSRCDTLSVPANIRGRQLECKHQTSNIGTDNVVCQEHPVTSSVVVHPPEHGEANDGRAQVETHDIGAYVAESTGEIGTGEDEEHLPGTLRNTIGGRQERIAVRDALHHKLSEVCNATVLPDRLA